MKAVVQRVKEANVTVNGEIVGKIDKGLLVLLGVTHGDTEQDIDVIANKLVNLRIFEDDEQKMNLSLLDVGGSVLSVSQFTLYGDIRKGRRPSFVNAAEPTFAEEMYEKFNEKEQARVDKWIEENDITIAEATNKYLDEQAIAEGKQTFETICATCHRADGGGGIGPNLTDSYWISKTQDSLFYNIYDIVFNGSPNNPQMRAFGQRGELTGLAIEKVASYVYHLNQEQAEISVNDGGAAPQGDFINEWARAGSEAPMSSEPETPVTTPTSDVTSDAPQDSLDNN